MVTVTLVPVLLGAKSAVPPYEAETVCVLAVRLEVVNVATPLTSGSLPSVPSWSLKVTVPPFGVAPPGDRSLTLAVNVTDCPRAAEVVEAVSAVRVGRGLDG